MQLPGDFLSDRVLPALLYPGRQATEAGRAGDIVYEEHGMDVPIVVLHHGLSETLLSRCVPQLELVARGETRAESESQALHRLALRGRWSKRKRGNEGVRRHGQEKKPCVEIPQSRQKSMHRGMP